MSQDTLLTTKEVADRLGVNYRTVHRMIERGEIEPAQKVPGYNGAYLFDPDVVEQYRRAA